jgi:hypothetical protein
MEGGGMPTDWDEVEARIEELRRNPPAVWRKRWPPEEEDVPQDYADGFSDAFDGLPKRAHPSPDYEAGWAAHGEGVQAWKRLMKARGIDPNTLEFSDEWDERGYFEQHFLPWGE